MKHRRLALVAVLALAACASAPREAFSVQAFVADAPAYVAARYEARDLPQALIADLEANDFTCRHGANFSECGSSRHAFSTCFDVITVRIETERVQAAQNRRCMGVVQ